MDIDNAVDAVILILELYPVLQSPQIIADVLSARRAGSGKDTSFTHSLLSEKFSTDLRMVTTLKPS